MFGFLPQQNSYCVLNLDLIRNASGWKNNFEGLEKGEKLLKMWKINNYFGT